MHPFYYTIGIRRTKPLIVFSLIKEHTFCYTTCKLDRKEKRHTIKKQEENTVEQTKTTFQTIDEYIALYPPETRELLQAVRATIRAAAPDAVEKISWQMPTYFQNGNLVHFAAHKSHIGFYPGPEGIEAFAEKLLAYKTSKGAVQFPMSKPLPLETIREMVLFRVGQNTTGK